MLKYTLLALLCLCSICMIQAQKSGASQDTIILQRIDTTFTLEHIIAGGQTLYSLSKIYQTTLPAIHHVNPDLMETELNIGDTINMPLNLRMLNEKSSRKASTVAIYNIQHGETLFAIAKRWLNVETAFLKKINNLESAALHLNQPLHLGWIDTRFPKTEKASPEDIKIAEMDMALIEDTKAAMVNSKPVIEQGKAIWKTNKSSADKPFVLHRTAKINSLVQLYNPMTGKKIHAKVVGRIPERNYDDNVMVVLTPYLANALKARDQAFFLKMKYTL